MSLVRRIVEVTLQLAPGSGTGTAQPASFDQAGSDTITISGTRTSVRIQNNGTPVGSTADVQIWGLSPDVMNKLYVLGMVFNLVPRNKIIISAGDEQSGLSPVFGGFVTQAYADFTGAPEVPLQMSCQAGLYDQVIPTQASSFNGPANVADIMAGFAKIMGLGFQNNGVDVTLTNSYYSGNVKSQMQKAADDANIVADFVDGGTTLAIWPKNGGRTTPQPVTIGPPPVGQMIGYPAFTQQSVIVRNVFDPRISYGQSVKIQTSVQPIASVGEWVIIKMDVSLDAEVHNGKWEQMIYAWNPKGGITRPVLPR